MGIYETSRVFAPLASESALSSTFLLLRVIISPAIGRFLFFYVRWVASHYASPSLSNTQILPLFLPRKREKKRRRKRERKIRIFEDFRAIRETGRIATFATSRDNARTYARYNGLYVVLIT